MQMGVKKVFFSSEQVITSELYFPAINEKEKHFLKVNGESLRSALLFKTRADTHMQQDDDNFPTELMTSSAFNMSH